MPSLRILIVEDESVIAMELQNILEDAGHTVVGIARSMQQALATAATVMPFDLAILDIDLAGAGDGIETAERLRSEHAMEALFVSARTDERDRALGLAWKPVGFVGKPYLVQQVLTAIGRVGHT